MARLVTIPISHYCEKARWALDLAGVDYHEDAWAPAFHRLPLARLRATTAPVFVTDEGTVLRQSTEIVRYADIAGGLGLFGDTPAERAQIEALVARFDRDLGPAARLLVYSTLLDDADAFLRVTGGGLSPRQYGALRTARPLVATIIRRFFAIDDDARQRAVETLERELSFSDEQRGGSRYLVGNRFSAADLTFCALLAPQVQPEAYGGPVPPLAEMPPERRADVARWRAAPAGAVVLELYAEHRQPATEPAAAGPG